MKAVLKKENIKCSVEETEEQSKADILIRNTKKYSQRDVDNITEKVKKSKEKELFESEQYQKYQAWLQHSTSTQEMYALLVKQKLELAFEQTRITIQKILMREQIDITYTDFVFYHVINDMIKEEAIYQVLNGHLYLKQNNDSLSEMMKERIEK